MNELEDSTRRISELERSNEYHQLTITRKFEDKIADINQLHAEKINAYEKGITRINERLNNVKSTYAIKQYEIQHNCGNFSL
jgi:hypothetical protein